MSDSLATTCSVASRTIGNFDGILGSLRSNTKHISTRHAGDLFD